jgi:hypothetical protein
MFSTTSSLGKMSEIWSLVTFLSYVCLISKRAPDTLPLIFSYGRSGLVMVFKSLAYLAMEANMNYNMNLRKFGNLGFLRAPDFGGHVIVA